MKTQQNNSSKRAQRPGIKHHILTMETPDHIDLINRIFTTATDVAYSQGIIEEYEYLYKDFIMELLANMIDFRIASDEEKEEEEMAMLQEYNPNNLVNEIKKIQNERN